MRRKTNINIEKLKELASEGHGFRALAELFGCDRTTIVLTARKYGIKILHAAPYVPLIEKPVVPPPPPPPVKKHPYQHLWDDRRPSTKNYKEYIAEENERLERKGVRYRLKVPVGNEDW